MAADLKAYDFRKVIDNGTVARLVKEGFFQSALRSRHQSRGVAQGLAGLRIDVRLKPDTTCVTTPRMHKLAIDGLTKRYYVERDGRQVLALSDVSLSVAEGEFMAIVGPSGCGKTTLLNIVAGLLRYDVGDVIIDGARIDGPGVDRAVVFQQSSLLPWRTIAGNVRYGMEMHRALRRSDDAGAVPAIF